MKRLVKIMAILLICGALLTPSAFAANDNENTDPDLSNNEASVTVEPYSVPANDSETPENDSETEETVTMQPTGVPALWVVLAFFMVITGFLTGKKN